MNIPLSIPAGAQPVYPSPGQHYIMQPPQMVLNNPAAAAAAAAASQPQYNVRPKRGKMVIVYCRL